MAPAAELRPVATRLAGVSPSTSMSTGPCRQERNGHFQAQGTRPFCGKSVAAPSQRPPMASVFGATAGAGAGDGVVAGAAAGFGVAWRLAPQAFGKTSLCVSLPFPTSLHVHFLLVTSPNALMRQVCFRAPYDPCSTHDLLASCCSDASCLTLEYHFGISVRLNKRICVRSCISCVLAALPRTCIQHEPATKKLAHATCSAAAVEALSK